MGPLVEKNSQELKKWWWQSTKPNTGALSWARGPLGLGPTCCEGRSPAAAFTGSPSEGELTFQNHEFIFLRGNIVVYTSWKEISPLFWPQLCHPGTICDPRWCCSTFAGAWEQPRGKDPRTSFPAPLLLKEGAVTSWFLLMDSSSEEKGKRECLFPLFLWWNMGFPGGSYITWNSAS